MYYLARVCHIPGCEEESYSLQEQKNSNYCINHICRKPSCTNLCKYGNKYCNRHKCEIKDCINTKEEGYYKYCSWHTCKYCHNAKIDNQWIAVCIDHKCKEENCWEDLFCIEHLCPDCEDTKCNHVQKQCSKCYRQIKSRFNECVFHRCTYKHCVYGCIDREIIYCHLHKCCIAQCQDSIDCYKHRTENYIRNIILCYLDT